MKANILIIAILLLSLPYIGISQETALPQKGSKVYVANESKNDESIQATNKLIDDLKEWAHWEIKSTKESADFILKADIKTSTGVTLTSWGGTSYTMVVQITNKEGKSLWESAQYKASPNGTNGFNAANAVVKKFMRAVKKKIK
ncbi:hypothetical protein [Sphingobacterium wenxiniae]|uniref:Uncharacterized protein n=1 Tax=Sphingobacterium wenxiniae TaxID=683125 RepID=A0A1I6VMF3_9SPHI|nr:hypothetical protein [Sphingobacterium wenxiniae]SFT14912.1 hypothetical protein SAMN05660206_11555 [Sphingobacterium wenxiniae]